MSRDDPLLISDQNCRTAMCFAQVKSLNSDRLSPGGSFLLLVFSVITIFACCASTVVCTRMARDQALAENARQIRKRYQRNKDLMYMLDMANAREPSLIIGRM